MLRLCVVLVVFGSPALALANFPPVAKGSASPTEVGIGDMVAFSSMGTFDPDDGPDPLGYTWDFGDGTTSTFANPLHAYDTLGLEIVTLTVSDGLDTSLVSFDVVVSNPPTQVAPTRSSIIALTPGQDQLWVVNPDSNTVSMVALDDPPVVEELEVGDDPITVATSRDGALAYVACQGSRELFVVDAVTLSVLERIPLEHAPFAVAVVPTDGRILVTREDPSALLVLHPQSYEPLATLSLAPQARALAVAGDGTRAYVSHFLTRGEQGTVTVVDLDGYTSVEVIALVEDPGPDTSTSGRGFPNLLGALTVDPQGKSVWVGGLKSNTSRGAYVDGLPLLPRNRVRGFMGRIDGRLALEDPADRIDTNDADSVADIAFSPRGRYVYAVHPGIGMLSVYDLPTAQAVETGDGATIPFADRVDVGHAPQGVVVTSDGTRAYVASVLSRSVIVLDLTRPAEPQILTMIAVTSEPLPSDVANGKRLFHRSRAPIHSDQGYIACASCHPDGGHDGRTWDFTQFGEGLRNTIDLRGRGGTAHGPVHWSANFDEIQDFENDIVNGFGGSGLAQDGLGPHLPLGPMPNAGRSADLDDLAAYVASLKRPPSSRYRLADGSLSAAAARGRKTFYDSGVGCAECHVPPRFTDSELTNDPADFVLHDVGTLTEASGGRLGSTLDGIDTPTLLGAWASPPYLHDGSAPDLLSVLRERNPNDLHGVTSHLSEADLSDLVAFVHSMDGSADELPDEMPGTGMDAESSGDDRGSETNGTTEEGTGTTTAESSASGAEQMPAVTACACRLTEYPTGAAWLLGVGSLLGRAPRKHGLVKGEAS